MILLDTNVLVYALNEDAPQHVDCRAVVDLAMRARMPAVLVPQVLVESYSVITSSKRVARPLTPRTAVEAIRTIRLAIPVIDPGPGVVDEFERLLRSTKRSGALVFDLYLVAQMIDHAVREICTLNRADFDVAGVTALAPADVLARYA